MKAYPLDLRQKVLAAALRGDRTIHQVADASDVGAMGLRGLMATLAVEGAVDTLCFDAYAGKVLAPRLVQALRLFTRK